MRHRPVLWLLSFSLCVIVSCGTNRKLQSISISSTGNGSQITFQATGTFNASPTTVTPLPVSWIVQDPTDGYSLSTQPFVYVCGTTGSRSISATAPANPDAPTVGLISSTPMVSASAPIPCP